MIKQTIDFMNEFKALHPAPVQRILEVGSKVAGSGDEYQLRKIFEDATEYIGIDMEDGENVDKVVNGHNLVEVFGKDSFDLVLCSDTLEHDNKFWVTVEQMKAVCKPGGWLIITVPSCHCPLHNHPSDYWRFMGDGVIELFDGFAEILVKGGCWDPIRHGEGLDEIFGWGMKPRNG